MCVRALRKIFATRVLYSVYNEIWCAAATAAAAVGVYTVDDVAVVLSLALHIRSLARGRNKYDARMSYNNARTPHGGPVFTGAVQTMRRRGTLSGNCL